MFLKTTLKYYQISCKILSQSFLNDVGGSKTQYAIHQPNVNENTILKTYSYFSSFQCHNSLSPVVHQLEVNHNVFA